MRRQALLLAVVAGACGALFRSAVAFAFLNWDDRALLVDNAALDWPGVVPWAFSTTFMEHYQPLAWLAWAGAKAGFGLDPAAFHAANLAAHVLAVALVWVVARGLVARAAPGLPPAARDLAGATAALLWGLHPLRVEVVAWASAMPYALATGLALVSTWVWLESEERGRSWWTWAVLAYGASLLARPVALGLPLVLAVLDAWLHKRSARACAIRVWPFALLAIAAAAIESAARAPGLADAPWLFRIESAASAPLVYLWHTVAPVRLTPLDVLPLAPSGNPVVAGLWLVALAGVSALAWRMRLRWPALMVAWFGYLALLAPAVGLVPSGLQATSDRYTYLPGVVVAMAAAAVVARWAATARARLVVSGAAVGLVALACASTSRAAMEPWRDSIALWTRVIELDPRNDVAHYNLALALAESGRDDDAEASYRAALAANPAHADARANLALLAAARFEREGNALASRGDLAAAAGRYGQAIALDAQRTHAQAARGMALLTLGRVPEAVPHLREAIRQGSADAEVASALGVALVQLGQGREAREVLDAALAAHPTHVGLKHNLARLLATAQVVTPADAGRALALAREVVEATGGRDARALETWAAALAADGRLSEARATNARAAALAEAQGERELAVQITARGRAYRGPGQ